MCVVFTTLPPTLSLAGTTAPFLITARRSSKHAVIGSGTGDHRHVSLDFGVGRGLTQHAVAASCERAYLGHSGTWVDVRVRSGIPVFLEHSINGMTNLWHLFEYVAYAFATKKPWSAIIEIVISAIKFSIAFHAVSRSTPLTPLSRSPSKARRARMPKWVTRRPCTDPRRGVHCLLTKRSSLLSVTGGAGCGLRCVRSFGV